MSPVARETINEVDFCGKVAAAANPIFAQLQDRCPFVEARIEGMGSTAGRTRRKDLRFYGLNNKLWLTGEVKLPGGPSAFETKGTAGAAADLAAARLPAMEADDV